MRGFAAWPDSTRYTRCTQVAYIMVLKIIKCVIVVLTQATDFLKKELKKKKKKVKGAAVVGAAVKDKMQSLERFARYAFNTVTQDSFTCKAHKTSAIKRDLGDASAKQLQARFITQSVQRAPIGVVQLQRARRAY